MPVRDLFRYLTYISSIANNVLYVITKDYEEAQYIDGA